MINIKQINIKNRTCYFFNGIINIEDFHTNLLKIGKNRTKSLVFTTLDILQIKKLMIMKIFIV